MVRRSPFTAALLAAVALSGCAGMGAYPSLERRPSEGEYGRQSGAAPVATGTPAPAPLPTLAADAPIVAQLATIRAAADAAHARFARATPAAERLSAAAQGLGPGADGWSQAQVALAELIAARSGTALALSDLDHLLVAAADAGQGDDSPELHAIGAVHGAVSALVADEDAVLEKLAGRVRG